MSHESVQTDRAPAAIGPYSQALRSGPWLFVSGQIGLNPETGELVGDDFARQAWQALDNMTRIIEAAGFDLTDVISVDVFMVDLSLFSLFNQIYGEHFSSHKPARAAVGVRELPKNALVELKCIAYRS